MVCICAFLLYVCMRVYVWVCVGVRLAYQPRVKLQEACKQTCYSENESLDWYRVWYVDAPDQVQDAFTFLV